MDNIIKVIEENYASFSKTEKIIGSYLLQEAAHLKNISIHHLSKLIAVSPSSITRFCRKVGCESFSDLKMSFNRLTSHLPTEEHVMDKNIFDTISNYYRNVIRRTADSLSEEQINRFIYELINADRIIFYGVASSGLTAKEMAMRLTRMGLYATSENDAHMMLMHSTIVSDNILVVAISNSGETKEIIEAMKMAKYNKATVIAVTSIPNSSVTKIADHTLFVHNTKFVNENQFINSQFAISFLFDIVCMLLLQHKQYHQNMKNTVDVILHDNHDN